MVTSYFEKYRNGPRGVSIAGRSPVWFKGTEYKKLAPKYWFWKKYIKDKDEAFYLNAYYDEVLLKLSPEQVYEEIGADSVILCWEKPTEFCHRQIVATWLELNLGIEVKEL